MRVKMVYLDNSATTFPKPVPVRQAVSDSFFRFGANPGRGGYPMAQKSAEAVYQVRQKLDTFFHGFGPEKVVFFPSCTAAINQVAFGLLRPGDHVVISDLEHNAVSRPVHALAERGVEFSIAQVTPGDNDKTLQAFRKALRKNTKLVICTAASNVWGIRLPVSRIAALCHIYEVEICVDGAQAAGLVDLNMQDFDYLCIPGHKGLYGPMGIGVLMMREGSRLAPMIYGGTGVNSRSQKQPEDPPERFESGTINVPGILGLGAGLQFVKQKKVEQIRAQELRKIAYAYDALSRMGGIRLYTARPVDPYFVPVLSFTIDGVKSEDAGAFYGSHGVAVRTGIHCAPLAHEKFGTLEDGVIRISPSVFTSEEDMRQFLRITRLCVNRKKS